MLLYPDLLTVQVRMDTLQVVGLEARSYWTNHVRRELSEPALSADEAAAGFAQVTTLDDLAFPTALRVYREIAEEILAE